MIRYVLRRGGSVLAFTLFTGALLLGFFAPSVAGDFVNWIGVFDNKGAGCEVTHFDSSFDPLLFPNALGTGCSNLQQELSVQDCNQDTPIRDGLTVYGWAACGFEGSGGSG